MRNEHPLDHGPESDLRKPGDGQYGRSPQSVMRVIRILETLSAAPKPMSLADLSRVLATPKSSLAALLRGLADASFVIGSDGTYRLGASAFGLGSALVEAGRNLQTPDLIREGLRRLAALSGETVLFAVRVEDGMNMAYVDRIEGRNPIRYTVSLGDRRPLWCTAGGRALLSSDTDEAVRQYLNRLRPERRTSKTETDRRQLLDAILHARETGGAQTDGEYTDGVSAFASVIRDASGATLGALIIAAPSPHAQGRSAHFTSLVLEEAQALSRSLGYRG